MAARGGLAACCGLVFASPDYRAFFLLVDCPWQVMHIVLGSVEIRPTQRPGATLRRAKRGGQVVGGGRKLRGCSAAHGLDSL
jgi:hypothetical protein